MEEGIELIEVKATNLYNYTAERNKRKQRKHTVLSCELVLITKVIRAVIATKKATKELKNHAKITQEQAKKGR